MDIFPDDDSYILNYLNTLRPEQLSKMLSQYLPNKLNQELRNTATRPPLTNLLNICGIPVLILCLVVFTKCVPIYVKLLVMFLVLIQIIISTAFIMTTENYRQTQQQQPVTVEQIKRQLPVLGMIAAS